MHGVMNLTHMTAQEALPQKAGMGLWEPRKAEVTSSIWPGPPARCASTLLWGEGSSTKIDKTENKKNKNNGYPYSLLSNLEDLAGEYWGSHFFTGSNR